MARRISGPGAVTPRRGLSPNRIFLPQELRKAIPDLPTCLGRDLELSSINAKKGKTLWFGKRVELELLARETGKLKGEFVVHVGLSIDAAKALGELLVKLADATPSRN